MAQLINRALTIPGLIMDPAMAGIGNSDRAMPYDQPGDDNVDNRISL